MEWYEFDDEEARRAHTRLSSELPTRVHNLLKMGQPDEKDEAREEYLPAWKYRGVWDV